MAWPNHIKRIRTDYLLEYHETPWGEGMYGTKEQLIRLGLGVGIKFPLSNRQSVKTTDPRGFRAKITTAEFMGKGIYHVSIGFPNRDWPGRLDGDEYFSPGVTLRRGIWFDEYIGTDTALVNAGLVKQEVFPGQPGMGKIQVTLYPNGEVRHSRNGHEKRAAGRKVIRRASKESFVVQVMLDREEGEKRQAQDQQIEDEWAMRMNALPRPPRLTPLETTEVLTKRAEYAKQDRKFQTFLLGLIK